MGLFFLRDFPSTLFEVIQSFGQVGCAGQAVGGIVIEAGGQVFGQEAVFHIASPTDSHRPAETAQDHLIEHDAHGIDIGLDRGGLAFEEFGRHVDSCAGQRRAGFMRHELGHVSDGDVLPVENLGVGNHSDAKIGQHDLRLIRIIARDQDIAGFDVFVDKADGVSRRESGGYLGDDVETNREGNLFQSALALRPFRQTAPFGIFRFDIEGRLFEIPVEDFIDVRTVAEVLFEEAE